MPILNYTTDVPVDQTIAEIQKMLVKANAKRVMVVYVSQIPSVLIFELHDTPYMLPCRAEAVHKLLQKQSGIRPSYRTPEHARRVAWRILKDWLEAQLAIVASNMVALDEVFLPYQVVRPGKTMYEVMREERPGRLLDTDGNGAG